MSLALEDEGGEITWWRRKGDIIPDGRWSRSQVLERKLGEMPLMSGNKRKGQVIEVFLCCARDIEFCSFYSGELFNAFKIGQVMNRIIYKKNIVDIPV